MNHANMKTLKGDQLLHRSSYIHETWLAGTVYRAKI